MSGVLHGVVASLKAAAAAATDSFFKYVTLLLHGDGTNGAQNNTFLDGSTNNFTITRNGNTTQGSFSPFSQTGWSNYFDGTGDWLSVPDNAAFTLGSGDFTVEAWIYNGGTGVRQVIGGQIDSAGTIASLSVYIEKTAANKLLGGVASGSTSYTATSTANLPLNQWVHVAFVRNGNTGTLYINGSADGTVSLTGVTVNDSTNTFSIGRLGEFNSLFFPGYISNFRLVKGTAVYTANFTPPTAPLTAISGTSLLTCQSNRFIDNSSNAFAITRNGDVRVEAFSPFNPTAAWSASTNGGSGYFDGTGDYLTAAMTALSFGTGNFTIEGWVYRLDTNTRGVFQLSSTAGGLQASTTNTLALGSDAGQVWRIYANGTAYNSTATWVTGAWYHFALVRNSGTTTLYINGTSVISQADTTNYTGVNIAISGYYDTTFLMNGYISNVRVLTGTAQYTAAFTPPTSPLTAITNTSLLLNFTNGGIFDNASQTVLETVGNAQVSTTQKKYGTGSMYFDGTGDWLTAIDRPPLRFGTGPFTIECWLYLGATGAARGIVGKGTATTGWLLSTDASNKVVFTYGSTTITSTAALSGSTWYFLTVVREGTGTNQTKIYIDGTNDGTGTVSTDFNQTSIMYVGADRTGGSAMNGYIDDLRITNGYARYTANFTPPTAAFPDN